MYKIIINFQNDILTTSALYIYTQVTHTYTHDLCLQIMKYSYNNIPAWLEMENKSI
jgi:hypothetical protein